MMNAVNVPDAQGFTRGKGHGDEGNFQLDSTQIADEAEALEGASSALRDERIHQQYSAIAAQESMKMSR